MRLHRFQRLWRESLIVTINMGRRHHGSHRSHSGFRTPNIVSAEGRLCMIPSERLLASLCCQLIGAMLPRWTAGASGSFTVAWRPPGGLHRAVGRAAEFALANDSGSPHDVRAFRPGRVGPRDGVSSLFPGLDNRATHAYVGLITPVAPSRHPPRRDTAARTFWLTASRPSAPSQIARSNPGQLGATAASPRHEHSLRR